MKIGSQTPFIIQDLETLKIIADPLRTQIFETLIETPHTVKQTADKLGLAASKLYYHFNLLEKHGLIKVVETRQVANMLEKHYQTVSDCLEVAPALMTTATDEGKAVISDLVTSTIDATREDVLRSLQARYFQLEQGATDQPRRLILTRQIARLSEAQVDVFQQRIKAILEDLDAASQAQPAEGRPYAFMVAFYPSYYFSETKTQENTDG